MENRAKLDYEFLESIVDGDAQFIKDLYSIFMESSKSNIDKLEKALESGDVNIWYASSHAFKGAASSIGAFDLANTLEESQKNPNYEKEKKQILLEKIKKQFLEIKQDMEKYMLDKYQIIQS